jgi:hypothetical protein
MLTRCLALLFIPILPFVPLMAPLGSAHVISAVVAGVVATVLAAFALVDDRARAAVAVVGGWVALSPFIFRPQKALPESGDDHHVRLAA